MHNQPDKEKEFEKRLNDPEWCKNLSQVVTCRYKARKRHMLTLCGITGAVFTLIITARTYVQNTSSVRGASELSGVRSQMQGRRIANLPVRSHQKARNQFVKRTEPEVKSNQWQPSVFPVSIGHVSFP